jgi:nucleoside-diphosphate-sugar epimerase
MRPSTGKARAQLGYAPRYEPKDAVLASVRWLIDHGQLEVASRLKV